MKEIRWLSLLAFVAVLGMCGCSETPKEDKQKGWHLGEDHKIQFNNNDNNSSRQAEEEGPQYQQPSMEVLQGKPQKFPAKYPVQRYPNSQVALVDVRANRPPGYLNMVTLKTVDAIPKVDEFYEQKMAAEQWKKVSDYHNEIYDSTRWEKGDMQCEVRISQDFSQRNGKRFVQLLYGRKPVRKLFKPVAIPSPPPTHS